MNSSMEQHSLFLNKKLEHMHAYEKMIASYDKKIAYFDIKLKDENLSVNRRQCYEGLKEVCLQEQKECRNELRKLVNGGV